MVSCRTVLLIDDIFRSGATLVEAAREILENGRAKSLLAVTPNNMLNLLERGKKVVVYFSPASECRTLRQIADVIPLLEHCPKPTLDEFEGKIDLAARINQPHARLNLV